MIEILIAKVFTTRGLAQLQHWSTSSYAQHVALGSFYEDIIPDMDKIVEVYQGMFGKVSVPELPPANASKNITKTLEDDVKWIADNRSKISKGISSIENLVDNLSATYAKTLYKLKNLS